MPPLTGFSLCYIRFNTSYRDPEPYEVNCLQGKSALLCFQEATGPPAAVAKHAVGVAHSPPYSSRRKRVINARNYLLLITWPKETVIGGLTCRCTSACAFTTLKGVHAYASLRVLAWTAIVCMPLGCIGRCRNTTEKSNREQDTEPCRQTRVCQSEHLKLLLDPDTFDGRKLDAFELIGATAETC